ncbi:tubby C-terminal-like domain-containing protein [Pterulicium gracile]|uniref:Tubby C-terminal-like domain-containing protein n=1 Tax=Pterulicium gracile TaxID=1884261 RepID=A0A5C3QVM4_9AGAR|nr:tubby C-terminal-like domain-containing protein [Pterula gracilis]
MGLFSSSSSSKHSAQPHAAPAPLQQPAPVPIGIIPGLAIHTQPITLKLEEQLLVGAGDDFYITDAFTGETVLGCTAQPISMSQRKQFFDAKGQLLFRIDRKLLAWERTFLGTAAHNENQLVFTLKSASGWNGTSFSVTFVNAADGQNLEICLLGDILALEAVITLGQGGPVIGRITREHMDARLMRTGQHTYYLTVAPGVDISLLSAICVCLDEVRDARRRQRKK